VELQAKLASLKREKEREEADYNEECKEFLF
jgi:hypothetical protein